MIKILIIDEDLRFQRALGISLQKYNNLFEAIFANSNREAISILEKLDIDLMVIDIQMGTYDGLKLVAWVSEHHGKVPCIMMTTQPTDRIESTYASTGSCFLRKPFTTNKFLDTVMEVLQSERDNNCTGETTSLYNFLQMIELERQTCIMEVSSRQGDKGFLYFENGEMSNAVYQDLAGEDAVFDIVSIPQPRIRFGRVPEEGFARRIDSSLLNIIMESLARRREVS